MKSTFIFLAVTFLSAVTTFAAPTSDEGKALFSARCASCHNVNKDLTGPALGGVDERRSIEWIINFVHSSQKLVKSGDKDAVAVYEKFNKIPMPDHQDLSEENIKSIVQYIKSETKEEAASEAPFRKPGKLQANYRPLVITNFGPVVIYLILVALLIGALLALVEVKSMQRKVRGEL
jgi:mono/diheme cytochrome c family protein